MNLTDREKAIIMSHEIRETINAMGLSKSTLGVSALEFGIQHLTKVLLPDLSLDDLNELIKEVTKFSNEYVNYIHELNKHPDILTKGLDSLMQEGDKKK